MKKLQFLLGFIGIGQITLGVLALFFPVFFLTTVMGLSAPSPDIGYPMGMLAARFFAYGIGMFVILRNPVKHKFWIDAMILIQVTDLLAGIFYTTTGIVALSATAFPMFNATIFVLLLALWRPKKYSGTVLE